MAGHNNEARDPETATTAPARRLLHPGRHPGDRGLRRRPVRQRGPGDRHARPRAGRDRGLSRAGQQPTRQHGPGGRRAGASSPRAQRRRTPPSPSSRTCSTRCWSSSRPRSSTSAVTSAPRSSGRRARPPQQRISDLGLADEDELQCVVHPALRRLADRRGRRLIGWDEILEGQREALPMTGGGGRREGGQREALPIARWWWATGGPCPGCRGGLLAWVRGRGGGRAGRA